MTEKILCVIRLNRIIVLIFKIRLIWRKVTIQRVVMLKDSLEVPGIMR